MKTVAAGASYLFGGYRRPPPPGHSYVRTWTLVPLLLAAPALMVPEMLALDFALWGAPAWRWGSDVRARLRRATGASASSRRHDCARTSATTAAFACASVTCASSTSRARTSRRSRRAVPSRTAGRSGVRRCAAATRSAMTLEGVGAVELTLREPVRIARALRPNRDRQPHRRRRRRSARVRFGARSRSSEPA